MRKDIVLSEAYFCRGLILTSAICFVLFCVLNLSCKQIRFHVVHFLHEFLIFVVSKSPLLSPEQDNDLFFHVQSFISESMRSL